MKKAHVRRQERGYAMAALLVAMSVMAIVLSTAMPVYQTVARREREAELVFRGEQYARAIALFQRKYANQLPPDVDVLIDQRFLRKKYKDPITGGDFQYLGAGSPELAQAMSTTPQQALDAQRGRGPGGTGATGGPPQALDGQRGRGAGGTGATGGRGTPIGAGFTGASQQQSPAQSTFGRGTPLGAQGMQTARSPFTAGAQAANAQAAGGILAVASKSTQTSMRLYNGKNKYNEWLFMATAASTQAGAPPGSGGQTPGGRGGRAGGRGGVGPGRGGDTSTPVGGARGRGGFSPRGARGN
jgi:type II secretory pathway pseudopilin PulG